MWRSGWSCRQSVSCLKNQAALKTAEGVLDGLRQTVTEAAVGMSESIAFSMLVVLFSVLFGRLIWISAAALSSLFGVLRSAHSIPQAAHSSACNRRRIRLHPADRAAVAVPDHLYVAWLSLTGAHQAYAAAQTACGRFTYRHLMENTLILHFPFFNFPFPKGVLTYEYANVLAVQENIAVVFITKIEGPDKIHPGGSVPQCVHAN